MARSTMIDIIQATRTRIAAGTADYTIGTADYWDADQIQSALDRNRSDIWRRVISPTPTYSSGTVQYVVYETGITDIEKTDGGTAVFYLEAGDNTQIGTANYSTDYARGVITFTADQQGSAYYLTARSYDLNAAAAEIWNQKSAYFAEQVTFATDGMRIQRSDMMKHAQAMAEYYEKRARNRSSGRGITQLHRSDNRSAAEMAA